jgi:lysophospholipase L1-like esterase
MRAQLQITGALLLLAGLLPLAGVLNSAMWKTFTGTNEDALKAVADHPLSTQVSGILLRAGAVLAGLAVALGTASAASASPPPGRVPPKGYYLALGDSIGYGFQDSKALAGLPPEAFNTGYVDVFAARLRQLRPGITTVNYSCPGESTTSFLLPCIWKASGHALHNDYAGSQLDAALAFLAAHRGQVSPVTVSLNGNDINAFLQSCPPGDLACIQHGAPAAIAAYQARLTSILWQLRASAPDAEIIVVGAYDPNVGAFAFADPLFTQVNQAQQAAAATVRARFADPFPVFNPQGDNTAETAAICTLTLLCTAGDTHPSDAGYRALADVVWAASGYATLQ